MQTASTPSWRHLWYWLRENPYPLTPDIEGCPLISEKLRLLCVYPAEGLFKMLKAILGRSSGKI